MDSPLLVNQEIKVGAEVNSMREINQWSSSGSKKSMRQVVEWFWTVVVRELEDWMEEEEHPLMEEGVE